MIKSIFIFVMGTIILVLANFIIQSLRKSTKYKNRGFYFVKAGDKFIYKETECQKTIF